MSARRSGQLRQWAIGPFMSGRAERSRAPRRRGRSPVRGRSTGDGSRTSRRALSTPNRWWASISSSPLFISVAESMVIFGPIDQVGWASAAAGVAAAISLRAPVAERTARRGDGDASRPSRRDARRESGRSRCARNRPAGSRHAARARRADEQVAGRDQAFLVGEGERRARRRARRSSARGRQRRRSPRPRGQPDAPRPRRRPRRRRRPRCRCRRAPPSAPRMPRRRRSPRRVRRPRGRRGRGFAALALAVTASTAKASGCAAITARVLVPIEPVAPRMEIRLGAAPARGALRAVAGGGYHWNRPVAMAVGAAVEPADQERETGREHQPVDAVHEAAVAGKQPAGVLLARTAA